MLRQFREIGKDLFLSGLVTSHAGNMSMRTGSRLIITRRGSMLGRLKAADLVDVTVSSPHSADHLASSELPIHRAIYDKTAAMAVIHAHPAHAVALSLLTDTISPPDLEASYLLGRIPVVEAKLSVVSSEAPNLVALALREAKVVVLRGHGSFAVGEHLEEALHWSSVLEHSCRIAYLLGRS